MSSDYLQGLGNAATEIVPVGKFLLKVLLIVAVLVGAGIGGVYLWFG